MSECLSECRRAAEQTAGLVYRAAGVGNEVPEGYTETEYDVHLRHLFTLGTKRILGSSEQKFSAINTGLNKSGK